MVSNHVRYCNIKISSGPETCYCIKKLDEGLEIAPFRTKPLNFSWLVHLNWLAKI